MVRRVSSLQTAGHCRSHSTFPYRNQLIFILLILFSQFGQAQAQVALGLYEGLMGNSGAALSEPTAASYYNPSLISQKKKSSYSLSGNTLGTVSSQSENTEIKSFTLNPSYLSTVMVKDSLAHEFYIANLSPARLKVVTEEFSQQATSRLEQNRDQTQFLMGYTMAFMNVPFALSYFSEYQQISTDGFREETSLVSAARSTAHIQSEMKSLGFGLSVSGYYKTETYSLGYQIRTRQVALYKTESGTLTSYTHTGLSATDYQVTSSPYRDPESSHFGSSFTLGHRFQVGDHEFLTDSQLQENSDLKYSYQMNQSFGYRMNSDAGHQVLCGLNHRLGPDIKYFGQSAYYSVGYSWLKNSLRSVVGLYVFTSRVSQNIFAAGLTFGSEFSY